jgi:hypothetical protein
MEQPVTDLDPFDLPDWLGRDDIRWEADAGLRGSHLVPGELRHEGGRDRLACALMAVDEAFPAPVVPDDVRSRAHQAWHHGQVLLVDRERTLTLAVPGRRFDAELVMEALARLAKAVGGSPDEWVVLLRIGTARR